MNGAVDNLIIIARYVVGSARLCARTAISTVNTIDGLFVGIGKSGFDAA